MLFDIVDVHGVIDANDGIIYNKYLTKLHNPKDFFYYLHKLQCVFNLISLNSKTKSNEKNLLTLT